MFHLVTVVRGVKNGEIARVKSKIDSIIKSARIHERFECKGAWKIMCISRWLLPGVNSFQSFQFSCCITVFSYCYTFCTHLSHDRDDACLFPGLMIVWDVCFSQLRRCVWLASLWLDFYFFFFCTEMEWFVGFCGE